MLLSKTMCMKLEQCMYVGIRKKKKKGKKHVISDWILSSLDKPNPWLTGANLSNIQLPTQICKGEPRGKIHCQPLLQVSVFVYHVRI